MTRSTTRHEAVARASVLVGVDAVSVEEAAAVDLECAGRALLGFDAEGATDD
ncbi:MAG: hypothetical protein HOJ86_09145 [Acidimicrobiaceae bacterium]|nr:hypothetical protein [Acidimicrobiaceae bacterium]